MERSHVLLLARMRKGNAKTFGLTLQLSERRARTFARGLALLLGARLAATALLFGTAFLLGTLLL